MKNLVLKGILLIVLFFVLDAVVGMFGNRMLDNAKWRKFGKEKYVLNVDTSDIFIFGSSRAEYHYVSNLIGDSLQKSVYNAGMSGCGFPYSCNMMKSMLKRHNPKMIILDVLTSDISDNNESVGFGINGAISSFKPYYGKNEVLSAFINSHSSFWERQCLSINLFKFNSEFLNLIASLSNKPNDFGANGYKKNLKNKRDIDITISNSYVENKEKMQMLEDLIVEIKERKIKLILIYSPSMVILDSSIQRELENISTLFDVPFYNFSKSKTEIEQFEFADAIHLNNIGAEIFSSILLDSLKTALTETN